MSTVDGLGLTTEEIRKLLDVPDDVLAVNAGTRGPMSEAVWDAMMGAHQEERQVFGRQPDYLEMYEAIPAEDRRQVARLIGCSEEEVALCESTTAAMNVFLWGLDLQAGDRIISTSLENPAALVPLRMLAQRRELDLVFLDITRRPDDLYELLEVALTPRTRAVLVSDVEYATGTRFDLTKVSALTHAQGALVLADGVQAVGTAPIDVKALGVDGYALARHKFLCGPEGGGALYVNSAVQAQIAPSFTGVFSDQGHGNGGLLDLFDSARRYEVSTRPLAAAAGAAAGLRWMTEDVGWARIFEATAARVRQARQALAGIDGVRVLGSGAPGGGLVSFVVDGVDPVDIVLRLTAAKVFCRPVLATDPACVRLSLGFWNRDSDPMEIARVVGEVKTALGA